MAKKGIKKHGDRAVADIYKESTQLEDMKVMESLDPTASHDHRRKEH